MPLRARILLPGLLLLGRPRAWLHTGVAGRVLGSRSGSSRIAVASTRQRPLAAEGGSLARPRPRRISSDRRGPHPAMEQMCVEPTGRPAPAPAPGEYVALAHEGVRLGGPMTVALWARRGSASTNGMLLRSPFARPGRRCGPAARAANTIYWWIGDGASWVVQNCAGDADWASSSASDAADRCRLERPTRGSEHAAGRVLAQLTRHDAGLHAASRACHVGDETWVHLVGTVERATASLRAGGALVARGPFAAARAPRALLCRAYCAKAEHALAAPKPVAMFQQHDLFDGNRAGCSKARRRSTGACSRSTSGTARSRRTRSRARTREG